MCGICGQYNYKSKNVVSIEKLEAMNSTLIHRGPNDAGKYINGHIGLAMRRLAIIDIKSGKQPIHNENKKKWIVFNGEIFNYLELKKLLISKGHIFYTSSDTETIVHLYEEYKENCVSFLRGMFAFAIWDEEAQTLFIARDRIGIKPLFYTQNNKGDFAFASEIKALLFHNENSKDIDLQAVDAYFTYGYIPAPHCIYKNIRKLLPGHWIKITENSVKMHKYWDIYFKPDYEKSEKYFIERFEEIFDEAVRIRLISEVPLGAFLSGGVDSSLITAFMSKNLKSQLHTFTVSFKGNIGKFLDERPYAKLVADKYKCSHKEIEVTPEIDELLGKILLAFDEPFADDSVIPSFYICQESRKAVTVALTGLGGDELFGGYERYLGFQLSMIYEKVPKIIRNGIISNIVESLNESRNGGYLVNHMKRFVRASNLQRAERYQNYVSTIQNTQRKMLYSKEISEGIDMEYTSWLMSRYYSSENAKFPLDRMFYQDIKTYLSDDILTLTDRIGMFHSQELRVPFTDHILMEFCATIPFELKIKCLKKKYLLKKIASKYIPKKVLSHRKQGFSSPMAQWLKSDLKPLLGSLLEINTIKSQGFLNHKFVEKLLEEHMNQIELNDKLIFSIIIFQKWCSMNNI